jgi:hypothetical protein
MPYLKCRFQGPSAFGGSRAAPWYFPLPHHSPLERPAQRDQALVAGASIGRAGRLADEVMIDPLGDQTAGLVDRGLRMMDAV